MTDGDRTYTFGGATSGVTFGTAAGDRVYRFDRAPVWPSMANWRVDQAELKARLAEGGTGDSRG